MNCCRWLLSPCICLCPCLEESEYLLTNRDRRATLSVSTHDDDWDADVGSEDQIKRTKANATLASEMQLQMQKLSGSQSRSMQNVMVTVDDDSTHDPASSATNWNGYSTTVQDNDQGMDSRMSSKASISPNNSSNSLTGRAPYRDIPYSDSQPSPSQQPKLNETVAPQNVSVSIDEDDDEEVEISLL